jgi:hypothetical protein
MKKIKFALLTISVLCTASAFADKDTRECAANLTSTGSFFKGKTFKTTATVPGIKQADAMKKAAQNIVVDGWQVTSTDSNLGIISAGQTVSYGAGKTAPLNIVIADKDGGVSVSITYSISGGVTSPQEAVQNQFCKIVEAIGTK